MELFVSIGERLREERKRCGLSQSDVAEIAADSGVPGATRQSQSIYEKGKRMPDAAYLAAVGAAGLNIHYIVTGKRNTPPPEVLAADERELLDLFRAAPLAVKAAAIGALQGAAIANNVRRNMNVAVGTNHGQIADGDMVVHINPGNAKK